MIARTQEVSIAYSVCETFLKRRIKYKVQKQFKISKLNKI